MFMMRKYSSLLLFLVYFLLKIYLSQQAINWMDSSLYTTDVGVQDTDNIPSSQYYALQDLYNSTNGPFWVWRNSSFGEIWNFSNPNANPCSDGWQGLTCNCGPLRCDITEIVLTQYNLSGYIPHTIGDFPELTLLSMVKNNIKGTLPSEIQYLEKLEELDLYNNELEGEIPSSIQYLQKLQFLDLNYNRFTQIPDELYSLSALQALGVGFNRLQCSISPKIGNLKELEFLELNNNIMTSSIPPTIGNLTNLQQIDLSSNHLDGTFPNELFSLVNLKVLTIESTHIGGTLSPLIGNLTLLETVYLAHSKFFGPLPDTICKLVNLESFLIDTNTFSGPMPSCLPLLTELKILMINKNSFNGTLDVFAAMDSLLVLYVESNYFEGSFNMSNNLNALNYLNVANNQLTGSLPWNDHHPGLLIYQAYNNYFSGELPSYTKNATGMLYFIASENYLSGSIPDDFLSASHLLYFLGLSENVLTGTISPHIGNFTALNQLILHTNRFTSTLPRELLQLHRIAVLDLSENEFTGTIPNDLLPSMKYLEELFLQENQFIGDIARLLAWNSSTEAVRLIDLDLSNNQFTGSLPGEFFSNATSLQTFVAASNCLDGSLPIEICRSKDLISLLLDGLSTADNCRQNIFPALTTYFNAFTLDYFIEGTIPTCFYELPNLQLLHVSGNGLSGSIPDHLNLSSTLTELSLSHNLLTGTIPAEIQRKNWVNLDLSYNKLTGTLVSDFTDIPDDGYLALEVNRISGKVPHNLFNTLNITILDGNIFSCNLHGTDLPKHDQNIDSYTCGSSNVNVVIVLWLFVVVALPLCAFLGEWILRKMKSAGQRTISRAISRSTKESQDGNQSTAISSPTEKSFFRVTYEKLAAWKNALVDTPKSSRVNTLRLTVYFDEIRRAILKITIYCVVVLLPVYSVLKMYNSSYSLEYAWSVSAMLLNGEVSAITIFIFLTIFVIFVKYVMSRMLERITLKAPKTKRSFLATTTTNSMSFFAPFREASMTFIRQPAYSLTSSASSSQSLPSKSLLSENSWEIFVGYLLIVLLNLLIMSAADFSYVYIVLNYSAVVVSLAALALAIFRLITNSFLLWHALPLTKRFIFFVTSQPLTKKANPYYDCTARDISFLENIILFNNIIIPVLAIVFILPDCFYNALFAAAKVTSTYSYNSCFQFIIANSEEHSCTVEYQSTTYSPPYLYSYQCSSKIIINYVTVYILLFLLVGIVLPCLRISLKLLYDRLGKSIDRLETTAGTPTIASERRRILRKYVEVLLPETLKDYKESMKPGPDEPEANRPTNGGDVEEEGSGNNKKSFRESIFQVVHWIKEKRRKRRERFDRIHFNKIDVTVQINSYITILVSFGALFPPLAVIACFSIFSLTYFTELCLGRLLHDTRALGYDWYEEQIEKECEDIEKSNNLTLWSTLFVSCCLFGYILFDTMGDTQGWLAALPLTVFILLLPLLLLLLIVVYSRCYPIPSEPAGISESSGPSLSSPLIQPSPATLSDSAPVGGDSSRKSTVSARASFRGRQISDIQMVSKNSAASTSSPTFNPILLQEESQKIEC